jgi:transposase InsO family protein
MKPKRRNFTSSFKTKVVLEALKERETIQQLGVKYAVHPNQITTWKKKFLENADAAFGQDDTRRGFMYLVAIIDVYSRYLVGWAVSNTMDAGWVVACLKTTMHCHGIPEIINSDQGSQFTGHEYIEYIKSLKTVKISMDGKGRATDNAYIERFFRSIKYEKLYLYEPKDGKELFDMCKTYISFYNDQRGHSSIGDVPPTWVYRSAA